MRRELSVWAVRGAGVGLGAAAVYAALLLGIAAGGVLLLLFVAILLASALEPIVGWIRGRTGLGRGITILLVYASFFVIVIGLAFVVVPAAIAQFNDIVARLPARLEQAREWAAGVRPHTLSQAITLLIRGAQNSLTPPPPDPDAVVALGLTLAEAIISVATLLAIVFFWLVEHARLQRFALAFLPAERRAGARDAWNQIETRLGLWVRGQLTLMAVMGAATGVTYTLLGVPSALLLALIAAVTEAIPIVGPLLGAAPAILVASTVSPELALAVAGIYLVIQFVEGNVLVPLVMRNTIGLSPFVVLVSLLIGAAAGGVVGALLAVPLTAAGLVILERLQAREVPVAQEPGAVESVDQADTEEYSRALPDAAGGKP